MAPPHEHSDASRVDQRTRDHPTRDDQRTRDEQQSSLRGHSRGDSAPHSRNESTRRRR
jgi:hypothetical protein